MARVCACVKFLLLLFAATLVLPQSLRLSPSVVTTYLGGDVHFICTKLDPSMKIAWDSPFLPSYFHSNYMNFSELNFTVPSISMNNTLVRCIGSDSNSFDLYYSNVGLIVIQGLLPEVAVNLYALDAYTIQMSWDHPFTQPGVPILGYNINITNLDTNSTESISINDTTLNIYLVYAYMVSIAGVNIVGEGNKTIIFIDSKELTDDTLNVTHIDVNREGSTWKVDATVENEHTCQVSYKFCEKANSTVCSSTNNITQTEVSNSEKKFTAFVFVPENQHYDITVINQIGKYSVLSSGLNMSTYDIQSVDERDGTNGSICFKINYVNGSIATGCRVLMNCESDDPLTFDIDGYNNQYHRFWCSPKPFYGNKTCSIQAYDKVYEVVESKSGPAVQFNMTVTGDVVIATQTSIPSSEYDPNILFMALSVIFAYVIIANINLFINKFPENVKHSNIIIPQHSATQDTFTTEIPGEFIVNDKEDALRMSKVSLTVQPQNEETKM